MANTQNYKKPITRKNTKAQTPVITARIDRMIDDDSKLKAFASVNVAGAVAIHGIHVMDSRKGLFVSMPSRSYTDASGQQKFAPKRLTTPSAKRFSKPISRSWRKVRATAMTRTRMRTKI